MSAPTRTVHEPTGPSPDEDARRGRSPRPLPVSWPRVELAGITTDLFEVDDALDLVVHHATERSGETLGVVSMNLDHLHHFGSGRTSARLERKEVIDLSMDGNVRWLTLLDGAPLVKKAGELTGRPWPRLAGSDLMEPILDRLADAGLSVGFLGGAADTHEALAPILAERWPALRVAGFWAPDRSDLNDENALTELAASVRAAGVDVLVVCLGKPRQERWIAAYGHASGAQVCLAFGAVVDFLAGRVNRAPQWIADHGLEWAWRLGNEPRRLARRYLIQGPPSYRALQHDSFVKMSTSYFAEPAVTIHPVLPRFDTGATFRPVGEHADVAAVVVTYNNADDIEPLVASLRREAEGQTIRLVVVDNDSTDDTVERARAHPDVIVVRSGGNLGYAGGINAARDHVGDADSVLILNPDLELAPGALRVLRQRLLHRGVAVAVPRILDAHGEVYASIRRDPTLGRALGDALLGERLGGRPAWLSEIEMDRRRYRHAHAIDWATGAALLIDAGTYAMIGDWDEQFFLYSEETDFLLRVRDTGAQVWYEPDATVQHRSGGSGSSDELAALLEVNRVRYYEKRHGRARSLPFQMAVAARSALRINQSRHRRALSYLVDRSRWSDLPSARRDDCSGS